MSDSSKCPLSEEDIAIYLDNRANCPQEILDGINCCPDCIELIASVLECAAFEGAAEIAPLSATQKREKLQLIKPLLGGDGVGPAGEPPATGSTDKPQGQQGNFGAFFTGMLGGQGFADLLEGGANSAIPALGDKGEVDSSGSEKFANQEDLHDEDGESEDFMDSEVTDLDADASIDLEDGSMDSDSLAMDQYDIDSEPDDIGDLDLDTDGGDEATSFDW